MADTATSRYLARKQSVGSNVNTWGDGKLNDDLDIYDRGSKGYQATAVTADATITWTNYSTSNVGQVSHWKLTGSLSATATLTMPTVEWVWDMLWNNTGASITLKCSGGTGVTIPTGRKAQIFCDGVDIYFSTPNYLGDDITEANNRDISDKAYVDATAAAAAIPGAAGTIKVDAAATAGYAFTVLLAGARQSISDDGDTMTFNPLTIALAAGSTITGTGTTVAVNTKYRCDFTASAYTITLPAAPTAGDVILLTKYGTFTMTLALNSLKFKGSTSNPTSSLEGQTLLMYTGASRGWVEL